MCIRDRAETETLLAGLEHIPRLRLEYRGAVLEEMDVDAIVRRSAPLQATVDGKTGVGGGAA